MNKRMKRKMYLRSLPAGEKFSRDEMEFFCREHHLAVPVERLIEYGEECNWLTLKGKSFYSCEVFCTVYNGIYLQEMRKRDKGRVPEDFSLLFGVALRILFNALENEKNFC